MHFGHALRCDVVNHECTRIDTNESPFKIRVHSCLFVVESCLLQTLPAEGARPGRLSFHRVPIQAQGFHLTFCANYETLAAVYLKDLTRMFVIAFGTVTVFAPFVAISMIQEDASPPIRKPSRLPIAVTGVRFVATS